MAPPCPIRSGRCWPRPTACTGGGQRCWNATSTSRRSRSLLTNSAPCAGTLQAQAAERAMSPDAPTDSLHAQLDALAGWIREPATHAPPPGIEQRRLDVYRERSEEHTSELQSLMRISYAGVCVKKKTTDT